MKKYLIGLFAIVLAIGLNAFTTLSENKAKGKETSYYWFEYDAGSGHATDFLNTGERSGFTILGCDDDEGTDCRRGYPITALVDSGDPSLGVTDDDANLDEIRFDE